MAETTTNEAIAQAIKEIEQGSPTVSLSSGDVDNDGAKLVAQVLAKNKTLRQLNLEWNMVSDSGALALAEALGSNNTLEFLFLTHNNVGKAGAAALAKVLEQPSSTLRSLNLAGNLIGDGGAVSLAKSLGQNECLHTLDLASNNIGDEGAMAVAQVLAQNHSLCVLNMESNNISTAGAQAIARGLEDNSTLTILNLSSNSVGAEGAIALADALERNATLRKLKIRRDNVPQEVLRRIAAALKRNQSGPSPPEATEISDKWLNAVKSAVAEGDQLAWNLAKLMVVGRGAAGKTSTVRSLLGQTPVLEHLSTEMADISRTRAQDWKPVNEDHNDFQTQVRLAASQRLQQNASSQQSPVGVDAALSIARATTDDSDRGLHAGNPGTTEGTSKAETAPESTSRSLQNLQKPLLAPEEVARRFQLRDEDEAFLQRAAPARKVSFSIWDYGGQRVFYALHHIFLTEKGLYLVVFDMRELVGADKFKTDLRPEEYARLGTQDESIDFLRFWLNSIKLHAPGAPVLLVGTHKDKVQDVHAVDCVLRKAEIVSSDCRLVKPNDGLLFFAVDNCSAEGDRASALREAVVSTAVTQAYIHDKVSLAWLKIREDLIKSEKPFVPMEEVVSMGIGYGRTREDVGNMLAYFHELGVVVHLRGSPTLERVVVMDPQWLLNKLARVVADDLHAAKVLWDERLGKSGLLQVYKTMRKEAIAPRPLLAWLWDEDEVKYLIEFMEANMLLCPWRFDAESNKEEYLVSALLSVTDQAVDTTRFERGLTCELDFSEFYLPDGVFYRLVAQCAVFATRPEVVEPGLPPRKPQLGTRLAAIYFGLNLFLLEVIKDDVIRLTVSAKAPRPALVIKVLVSMLREQEDTMFRKLPWRLLLLAPGTEKRAEYKIVERAISVTKAKHVWSVDDGDEQPIVVAKFAPFFHEQIGPLDTDEDGPAVPKVKQTLTLGPGMLTHIFVSHKQSSGGDLADMLRLKLENRGLKVWFDQAYNHALNHAAMLEGVRQSRAYVLVLTKGVFSSEAVMTELRCALEIGKPVILVHESETHRESYTPFPEYVESAPAFCKDIFLKTESLPVRRKWYEEDGFLGELVRRALS